MMTYIAPMLLLLPAIAAANPLPEKYYQEKWCADQAGQVEHILPDRTRVDCLTATHAVEVDFGKKWAEAIGQSLYYSHLTGLRPGVLLIVGPGDSIHWLRTMMLAKKYGIDVWTIDK